MTKKTRWIIGLFGAASVWGAGAEEAVRPTLPDTPFWLSQEMKHEPILFVQAEGAARASGRLLFVPDSPPVVYHSDGVTRYEAGKDYLWTPGTRLIELPATTSVPFKTAKEMAPGKGVPGTLRGVLHAESNVVHKLQTLISYSHGAILPDLVVPQTQRLPRSVAKLSAKKPFKMVTLGDSISEGYNASGFKKTWAAPYQPAYPQLVADVLARRFDTPVSLTNLAIAGRNSGWGLKQVPAVLRENPDLVLLAFGMNDRIPSEKFGEQIRETVKQIQAGAPKADIVLVSSMSDNPLVFGPGRLEGHLAELKQIEGPNVAVADITTPWGKLVELKSFADISGNHFNHPNDFGHRLYADVIASIFRGDGAAYDFPEVTPAFDLARSPRDWRKSQPVIKAMLALGEKHAYQEGDPANHVLWVYRPDGLKADAKRPAVVYIHGGSWGGHAAMFAPHCLALSRKGVVGVTVEFRRYNKAKGISPRQCLADCLTAYRWVKANAAKLNIDPDRIALAGGSAGAHLALSALTLEDAADLPVGERRAVIDPKALILINPAIDLVDGWKGGQERCQAFDMDPATLSPAHRVREGLPPTLVISGSLDDVITPDQVRAFQKRMEAKGNRCTFAEYPGLGHGVFNYGWKDVGSTYLLKSLDDTETFLRSLPGPSWFE